MGTQVIVLNGGSSSGKTTIARCLQGVLPQPWLRFSVDDLVDALPPSLLAGDGIGFDDGGGVAVGGAFREAEAAWMAGVRAMVLAGARLVLDDVFLGGAASQSRTRRQLAGLEVLWVGVRCPAEVAVARELARGDRTAGMALAQAEAVHDGVHYDVEVDSSRLEALECAWVIAERARRGGSGLRA